MGTIAFGSVFLCTNETNKNTRRKMKKNIANFILLSVLGLASCCKIETVELPALTPDAQVSGMSTKSEDNNGCAYVRIAMFEDIEDYNVTVTDMWFEAVDTEVEIPEFGSDIATCGILSSSYENPSFDTEEGAFHSVNISRPTAIRIHFNLVLECEDGSCTLPIEDAVYTIKRSKAVWANGSSYTYIIRLDPQTLGLTEITFNPTIGGYQDVIVNC